MEVELSLEPEISEGSSFNPGQGVLSPIEVENEKEARAFLHHSILMDKFKEFVSNKVFVDLQIMPSDLKVIIVGR